MEKFINDSGFLLNSYRYDEEKRTSVVISFTSVEDSISKYKTIDEIRYHLGIRYSELTNEHPPYHYVITSDGKKHYMKDPELVVPSNNCRLDSYKDDIKILVMADRLSTITEEQKEAIINTLANESEKYALLISNTIFCQITKERLINDESAKEDILKLAILKRNQNNSLFCIAEHVINNNIVTNDKVTIIPPLTNELSLDDLSIKYNVPKSILLDLNPHLKTEADLDIVFIPNTTALNYKISANVISKELLVNAYDIQKIKEEIDNVL